MEKSKSKKRLINHILNDLWILLMDIIAVNLSYLLALYMRFFVNGAFRDTVGFYKVYFWRFAPFYTIIAIAVFALFKLYGSKWKYAGINDMNRIISANAVTAILHVVGSVISLALMAHAQRTRMPLSYYVIGAILQFFFIVLIRFSQRFLMVEKAKFESKKNDIIPTLVVGSGAYGQTIIRHLESNTPFRAVAIAGEDSGRSMDGIPIISMEDIPSQISAKGIKAVFIADKDLSREQREEIKQASGDLVFRDYTGQLSNQTGFLPVSGLMETVEGPVTIEIDGKETQYASGIECLNALDGEYEVTGITVSRIKLRKTSEDDSWMKEYRDTEGMDVSFF